MTGYTPIYNLPYVEPSDLVASYPTVSEELAENVETAIAGSGGLSLIVAQTFTSVSTVAVNNCFTSTYQNYKLFFDITAASATGFTNLQFTLSGTASTEKYARSAGYTNYGGTTPFGESQNNASSYNLVYATSTDGGVAISEIMRPAQAVRTYIAQNIINFGSNGGWGNGEHAVATAYDGFQLTPASGTITGTLRVYGFKN